MKKVSIHTILLVAAVLSPMAARAADRTADEIIMGLNMAGTAPTTIRYHGDDASLGSNGLQHNGSTYANSYISSGFGAVNAAEYQNVWQVYWPAGTAGAANPNGASAQGIAQCTRAKPVNGTVTNAATFGVANPDMIDSYTTKTEDGELQCWCKLTGIRDAAGTAGPNDSGWIQPSSRAPWVFNFAYGSAAACAYACACDCAANVRGSASFRSAVLGPHTVTDTNRAMCGENLISGYAGDVQLPRSAKLVAGTYTMAIFAANGGKWAIRLRDKTNQNVVTGEALTTALTPAGGTISAANPNFAAGVSAAGDFGGWVIGDANGNSATFTITGEYIVEIAKLDATNTQKLALVRGNTAPAQYIEPNACIVIATSAHADAAFERVQYILNHVVDITRNVVTNTINQTAAIADLQATKQTRPADDYTDETNTENCPKFRQCLLVEDDNNTPHWYVIKDPVRDLVKSLRDNKINSAGETTTTAYAANGYDGTAHS